MIALPLYPPNPAFRAEVRRALITALAELAVVAVCIGAVCAFIMGASR